MPELVRLDGKRLGVNRRDDEDSYEEIQPIPFCFMKRKPSEARDLHRRSRYTTHGADYTSKGTEGIIASTSTYMKKNVRHGDAQEQQTNLSGEERLNCCSQHQRNSSVKPAFLPKNTQNTRLKTGQDASRASIPMFQPNKGLKSAHFYQKHSEYEAQDNRRCIKRFNSYVPTEEGLKPAHDVSRASIPMFQPDNVLLEFDISASQATFLDLHSTQDEESKLLHLSSETSRNKYMGGERDAQWLFGSRRRYIGTLGPATLNNFIANSNRPLHQPSTHSAYCN